MTRPVLHRLRRVVSRSLASVRVRVTVAALLAVGCALGAAALVVDAGLQHDRQRVLTSTAQQEAREIAEFNPQFARPLVLPANATIQSGLVQVLRTGRILGASRLLRNEPPLWSPGEPEVQREDSDLSLGKDVQTVAVPVSSVTGVSATVVVVISLYQYDHSVAFVERLVDWGMPLLFAVVGLICWLIVGRALRPIELMRREVAEVVTVRGGHRIPEPAPNDEVGRLARTLNSMLDRIEASSQRERRFVSDASHELRSPIANVRTTVEVALHRPDRANWPSVAEEVLAQNERMGRLVESLLILARSDEGGLPRPSEPTDLAQVAESIVDSWSHSGSPAVTLKAEPVMVAVPLAYLERVVANLVDNARRFAATRVEVEVTAAGPSAILRVRDDGPGVAAANRRRIFERFVRLDEARDRGEGGFGLGLAIVSDLCTFYSGTVEVQDADPGAVFVLRFEAVPGLPRAAASSAQRGR